MSRTIPAVLSSLPLALSLALVSGTPLLAQAPAGAKDPDGLLAKAVALHQSGDTLGAIQYYEAVLELQPGRVEARSNLGAALMKLGRYEQAVEQYRKAIAARPDLAQVRLNLGLAFYKADRITDALPEFEAVLKAMPQQPAATLLFADCLLRTGQAQRVVELLSPLENTLGQDRLFSYLLGTALLEQNQLERGQQLIDRLFREGDSAEARVLLGAQHLARGNHLKALPELKRAVELNPNLPSVHALYARALRADRDHEGAAREYLKELERNPNDFESNLWLGLLRREENRLDEAGEYLKRASRLRPRDPSVAYAFGRVHLQAGRLEEARKALELLVEVSPGFQQGHVLLATVYYRLNQRELGDKHKAIVDRLRAEAAAKGEADEAPGATSFGDAAPPGR